MNEHKMAFELSVSIKELWPQSPFIFMNKQKPQISIVHLCSSKQYAESLNYDLEDVLN